jgi:hypothetical protein
MTLNALRHFAPAAILVPLALSAACGDGDTGSGGGGASGGTEGVGAGLEGGICIDRAGPLRIVEPSGLQLKFRVLDVNGEPLRPLVAEDVNIINDEKGVPFGEGAEGDSVSNVGATDNIQIFSVVALDLSDSIFAAGAQDDVINAAREFVSAVVTEPEEKFKHQVLFLAFGRPEATVFLGDFTQDTNQLLDTLDDALAEGPRGTTALYNAYLAGLAELESRGDDTREVVERFLVLLTDGTHEAGGEATLRGFALDAKHKSRATIYTVGIQGTYDACRLEELAGRGATPCSSATRGCREGTLCTDTPQPPSCTQFFPEVEAGGLSEAFRDVATRVEGIARSNYSVGICTPVAQSNSSVTLQVEVDGLGNQTTLGYCAQGAAPCATGDDLCACTALLTGQLDQCDAESVRTAELEPIQTCPAMEPTQYQCSYLQIPNQTERGCPIKPDDYKQLCLLGVVPEVPEEWFCDAGFYDADDGCDCGCGALDPDCENATEEVCGNCLPPSCAAREANTIFFCDFDLLVDDDNSRCVGGEGGAGGAGSSTASTAEAASSTAEASTATSTAAVTGAGGAGGAGGGSGGAGGGF